MTNAQRIQVLTEQLEQTQRLTDRQQLLKQIWKIEKQMSKDQ